VATGWYQMAPIVSSSGLGMATCSHTPTYSAPARSAAWATATRSSTPASASQASTKMRLWAWIGSWRPQATAPLGMTALT
jgi:hypothetical protein